MSYDSAYSTPLAEETGMKYFIYLGGRIQDSRDFCVALDGKVWSRAEAEKLRDNAEQLQPYEAEEQKKTPEERD